MKNHVTTLNNLFNQIKQGLFAMESHIHHETKEMTRTEQENLFLQLLNMFCRSHKALDFTDETPKRCFSYTRFTLCYQTPYHIDKFSQSPVPASFCTASVYVYFDDETKTKVERVVFEDHIYAYLKRIERNKNYAIPTRYSIHA